MELTEELTKTLIKESQKAKSFSYSPYSNFAVGAALLTKSGKIYTGCNVENASYGGAICAERTACVKAVSEGEKEFEAIAISSNSKDYIPPCGFCRQFLVEFGTKLKVISTKKNGEYKINVLEELLPDSFGPHSLNI
ncbi:cytidine deaminase, partial [Piromyces finnis]